MSQAPYLVLMSEEAARSAQLDRQINEVMPDALYVVSAADCRLLYINQNGAALLGRPSDELLALGANLAPRLAHPDDLAGLREHFAAVQGLPGDQAAEIEYRLQHADGGWRWLRSRDKVFSRDPDGRVLEVVGTARDITERYYAAERERLLSSVSDLLASSIDYDTTLASIAKLIIPAFADWCTVDIAGAGGSLNAALIAHTDPGKVEWAMALREQYPPDPNLPIGAPQVIRTGQPEIYPEITDEQLQLAARGDEQQLRLLQQVGYRSIMVLPLATHGRTIGAITFVSTSATRRYDQHDLELAREIARRAATALAQAQLFRDASQARRDAEQAAERTTRLLAVTADLAQSLTLEQAAAVAVRQGCAALGAFAGLVARFNPSDETLEILHAEGYSDQAVQLWQHFKLGAAVPLADAIRRREPVLLESPAQVAERYPSLPDIRLSGSQALVALPLLVADQAIGVFGLSFAAQQQFAADDRAFLQALAQQCAQALDRARLYDAERAARADAEVAVRTRDQFLSIAAHELRNPLAALFGHAQLLERRAGRDSGLTERDQRSVLTITEQAARLNRMIDDLLDVSRMGLEQFNIARATLDLVALVSATIDKLRPTLARHLLSVRLPDEPIMLQGDVIRLEQVVSNLLSNAAKYSPVGTPITVELTLDGSRARLSVADEGIGIPAASLPHLFQRFYRADNAEKAGASGLGIGLYVVKEVVERHGGSVSVVSEEGGGSVFSVWLPLDSSGELRPWPPA